MMKRRLGKAGRRGQTWAQAGAETGSVRVFVFFGIVAAVVVLFALMRRPAGTEGVPGAVAEGGGDNVGGASGSGRSEERAKPRLVTQSGGSGAARTPAAVVADKVAQFSQGRRQLVETLAQKFNVTLSPEVDRFFAAVESGDWREIKGLYNTLSAQTARADAPPGMASVWPAIRETYAVAEAKEVWPADQLLTYGQSVLAALKPGSVYVGTSDWGRAIPSLMNETSGEGRSVLLNQASLSDPGYIEYLGAVYGDRITAVAKEDAEKARSGYLADLQERSRNNQLRPGESVPSGDAPTFQAGSAGASAIADQMLLALLEKNPGLSVAVERLTPGSPLYDAAVPMGPIFEIRGTGASGGAAEVSSELAAQSVNYWRQTVEKMESVPMTDESVVTRRSLAEMAVTQANLLASRSLGAEAEQTFRSALEIAPASLEPVGEFAQYLQSTGRAAEAQRVLDEYLQRNPGREGEVNYFKTRLNEPKK